MKNILIHPNIIKDSWLEATRALVDITIEAGCVPVMDEVHKESFGYMEGVRFLPSSETFSSAEMVISLGGDGTLMAVAHRAALADVPVLGVNIGTLGYLVELEADEHESYVKALAGDYTYDIRDMLDISVLREGHIVSRMLALNEALVAKAKISHPIDLEFYADGSFIKRYRADGLIIATPTGSTAYSLSAGGPVIEPQTQSVVITPVSSHSLVSIPIVMSLETEFEVRITQYGNNDVYLAADGEEDKLFPGDIVKVRKAKQSLKLIRVKDRNFYDILREKLEERV